MAADGWSVVGIAEKMGVTQKTFDRWRNEYDDIREAFNRGRERERRSLHNRLYRTAIEGEGREAVLAAMFILKTRHGYREGDPVDSGGTRVNIFNLPGPMTREEFMKTVVGDERG